MYHARLSEILRLLVAAYRYPTLLKLAIPQQGLGLARRHEKCVNYWNEHLNNSKAAQIKALDYFFEREPNKTHSSISILGAGKLYDVATEVIQGRFNKVFLQDVDPLCLTEWKKLSYRKDISYINNIADITGCFEPWFKLVSNLEDKFNLDECFRKLLNTANPYYSPDILRHDLILSQNLLSQIPLYFMETTKNGLKKSKTRKHIYTTQDLDNFYPEVKKFFIGQHLQSLNRSQARMILVTSDFSSCDYTVDIPYQPSVVSPPPVDFQSKGWVPNNTSNRKIISASYRNLLEPPLDLKLNQLEAIMNNYQILFTNDWIWHLSPQGLENKSHGCVHSVKAVCLQLKS